MYRYRLLFYKSDCIHVPVHVGSTHQTIRLLTWRRDSFRIVYNFRSIFPNKDDACHPTACGRTSALARDRRLPLCLPVSMRKRYKRIQKRCPSLDDKSP